MNIKEDFLHYIWNYKLFDKNNLQTLQKEHITILNSGSLNINTGPDFFNAKIVIGEQTWAGNVEIHVKSSDWYIHNHQKDINYDSVILHVVWLHDVDVYRKNNTTIPTLELKKYISGNVLDNYRNLFSKIITLKNLQDCYTLFSVTTSNFWKLHYNFNSVSNKSIKKLSKPFIDLLVINTIIPLLFVYYKQLDTLDEEEIFHLIKQIKPEKTEFVNLKIKPKNALETQAILHLKKEYCKKHLCLHCAIGNVLLNKK